MVEGGKASLILMMAVIEYGLCFASSGKGGL